MTKSSDASDEELDRREVWFVQGLPDKCRPNVACIVAQTRLGSHTIGSTCKYADAVLICDLHNNRGRADAAPRWFDPLKHGHSALLVACAHAGMTAAQALDELSKESESRRAMVQRLLEQATPMTIVVPPESTDES